MRVILIGFLFITIIFAQINEGEENTGIFPPLDNECLQVVENKNIVSTTTPEGIVYLVGITRAWAWEDARYRYVAAACTSKVFLQQTPVTAYYVDVFAPYCRVLLQYTGQNRFDMTSGTKRSQEFENWRAGTYYDYRWEYAGDEYSRVLRVPTSYMMYYPRSPGYSPTYTWSQGLVHNPDDKVR